MQLGTSDPSMSWSNCSESFQGFHSPSWRRCRFPCWCRLSTAIAAEEGCSVQDSGQSSFPAPCSTWHCPRAVLDSAETWEMAQIAWMAAQFPFAPSECCSMQDSPSASCCQQPSPLSSQPSASPLSYQPSSPLTSSQPSFDQEVVPASPIPLLPPSLARPSILLPPPFQVPSLLSTYSPSTQNPGQSSYCPRPAPPPYHLPSGTSSRLLDSAMVEVEHSPLAAPL